MTILKHRVLKAITLPLTTVLVLSVLLSSLSVNVSAKDSDDNVVVVSMGDSFSSGEANEPFYGQIIDDEELSREEKAQRSDWTSHRSTTSWPGQLKFSTLDKTLSAYYAPYLYTDEENKDCYDSGNWYFVAASGARSYNVTEDALNSESADRKKEISKEVTASDSSSDDFRQRKNTTVDKGVITHILPYQTDIFDSLPENDVADYVTISIGGNDVGFADIIATAVKSGKGNYKKFYSKYVSSSDSSAEGFENIVTDLNYQKYSGADDVFAGIVNTLVEFGIINDSDGNNSGVLYNRLKNTYKSIIARSQNPDLRIIALGYPRLIDEGGMTEFIFFLKTSHCEAVFINKACAVFDEWMEKAIVKINEDLKDELKKEVTDKIHKTENCSWSGSIYYTSVLDKFGTNHLAGASKGEWINSVLLADPNEKTQNLNDSWSPLNQSDKSVHPNADGVKAYAECAQETINNVECSISGTVCDAETGNYIKDAIVRVYKADVEEASTKKSFPFINKFFKFVFTNVFEIDDSGGQSYATSPDETNKIAELVTDETGHFRINRLPSLEEGERLLVKVYSGGYSTISYYTVGKRYADCVNAKGESKISDKTIKESGSIADDCVDNDTYYYYNFKLEKQDAKKMLCGTWQSDSFHWATASYIELNSDGTCSLDMANIYKWSIYDDVITFTDTVGAGYEASYRFDVTEDMLVLYKLDGTEAINNLDQNEKAVFYKQ